MSAGKIYFFSYVYQYSLVKKKKLNTNERHLQETSFVLLHLFCTKIILEYGQRQNESEPQ